jgi:ABC-type Fe3+/spermidine/putrescine transport system ATPase subunit
LFAVRVVEVAASRVGLHLTAPDAAAELHGWTGTVAAGETRTLLLRPEQMRIERVDPGPGTNRIAGEVRGVSFLGSASVILVQAAAGPVIEVRSNGPAGVAAGDRIWTCWEPHSGVLLEPR